MNGTIYKPGGVVVLSMEADPTFGLIEDILSSVQMCFT